MNTPGPVSPQQFAMFHRWLSAIVEERLSCPQIMVAPLRYTKDAWDPEKEPAPMAKRYDSWQVADMLLKRISDLDFEAAAWRQAAMMLLSKTPWSYLNAPTPSMDEVTEARRVVERLWREHLEVNGGRG